MIVDQFIFSAKKRKENTQSEGWSRSVLKSISWRIIGTLDTILISYIITGKLAFALSIGGIELVTKMVLYVVHERVWNTVKWGRK